MVNVKTYKDGDRFILMIENCTGELAEKVNQFLADILGPVPEPQTVPGLEPMENCSDDTPQTEKLQTANPGDFKEKPTKQEILNYTFETGTFKGYTLKSALNEHGINAAVKIACEIKSIEQPMRKEILDGCKQMIAKDLTKRKPQNADMDEIDTFIHLYKPLAQKGIQQILSMSGYSSLEEFFVFSDEKMQRDAYEALIDALKEKVK